jgi:uncharacterized phage infection (PIP) family protein YhgE
MLRGFLIGGMAITAFMVAGCSSADTKNDYVDTVDGIRENAIDAYNQTVTPTSADTKGQIRQLEAAEDSMATAVAELEAVDVPEEAEESHREMVAGYQDLRALFAQTAADLKSATDVSEALQAMSAVGAEGDAIAQQIDDAVTQINEDLGAN